MQFAITAGRLRGGYILKSDNIDTVLELLSMPLMFCLGFWLAYLSAGRG